MRILCYILVVLFVTTSAFGQQINPVPDYIFRNSMSVGRNAPTDTSAYFSIGPRFGATRGFMPPMVVDTAAVTGTKRNGLLIYSIQRNSYLYWDSTGNRWSRLASLSDTITLSTRAWRQKGIDSVASVRIGGSGTTNYVSKFSAGSTLTNSVIQDNGTQIGIGIAPNASFAMLVNGSSQINGSLTLNNGDLTAREMTLNSAGGPNINNTGGGTIFINTQRIIVRNSPANSFTPEFSRIGSVGIAVGTGFDAAINVHVDRGNATAGSIGITAGTTTGQGSNDGFQLRIDGSANGIIRQGENLPMWFETNGLERMRIFANGRIGVNTTTDAGYQFDVAGTMRNTTGANLATSSGNVVIGSTGTGNYKLDVTGGGRFDVNDTLNSTLVVRGKVDAPDLSGQGGGYLFLEDRDNSGYANLQMGGMLAAPYFFYMQANNNSVAQTIALNPIGGEVVIGSLSDAGAYTLQVTGNTLLSGNIRTAAPAGGTANDWRLGTVATVSPTSPNRTIEVEIGGTIYYIHAKTTND